MLCLHHSLLSPLSKDAIIIELEQSEEKGEQEDTGNEASSEDLGLSGNLWTQHHVAPYFYFIKNLFFPQMLSY